MPIIGPSRRSALSVAVDPSERPGPVPVRSARLAAAGAGAEPAERCPGWAGRSRWQEFPTASSNTLASNPPRIRTATARSRRPTWPLPLARQHFPAPTGRTSPHSAPHSVPFFFVLEALVLAAMTDGIPGIPASSAPTVAGYVNQRLRRSGHGGDPGRLVRGHPPVPPFAWASPSQLRGDHPRTQGRHRPGPGHAPCRTAATPAAR